MCLATSAVVTEIITEKKVKVELSGVSLEVSSALYPNIKVGDYVLLHAGFIIEKITKEHAQGTATLYEELKRS